MSVTFRIYKKNITINSANRATTIWQT